MGKMQNTTVFESPQELLQYSGKVLGKSDWFTIDQARINFFADATGDHQWIHTDEERAARELEGGRTIAHGLLVLAMLPKLFDNIFEIKNFNRGLIYGFDKIRFITPVLSNAKVRLQLQVGQVRQINSETTRAHFHCTLEAENQEKPAICAEFIAQYQTRAGQQKRQENCLKS